MSGFAVPGLQGFDFDAFPQQADDERSAGMRADKVDAGVKAVLIKGEGDLANRVGGLRVQFGDEFRQFLPAVGLGQVMQQGVDETAGGCPVPFAPAVAAD